MLCECRLASAAAVARRAIELSVRSVVGRAALDLVVLRGGERLLSLSTARAPAQSRLVLLLPGSSTPEKPTRCAERSRTPSPPPAPSSSVTSPPSLSARSAGLSSRAIVVESCYCARCSAACRYTSCWTRCAWVELAQLASGPLLRSRQLRAAQQVTSRLFTLSLFGSACRSDTVRGRAHAWSEPSLALARGHNAQHVAARRCARSLTMSAAEHPCWLACSSQLRGVAPVARGPDLSALVGTGAVALAWTSRRSISSPT